jgi:hypothetical protein
MTSADDGRDDSGGGGDDSSRGGGEGKILCYVGRRTEEGSMNVIFINSHAVGNKLCLLSTTRGVRTGC